MINKQSKNSHIKTADCSKSKKIAKLLIIIISIIVALIILIVGTFFIMSEIGKHSLHKDDKHASIPIDVSASEDNDGSISYNGNDYKYNNNIVSVLFMGIDKQNIDKNSGYGGNGQADAVFIACLDTKEGTVKIIPISRETMVDVNLYSTQGQYSGIKNQQLCLAYSYGNTTEESCKNVVASVNRLLYGINVSSYVAIDLDGVSTMSNMIGGVTVTPSESIGEFKSGQQVLLKGDNAISYIQLRGDDEQGNTRRMDRQKQFLNAFASKAGNQILSNFTKLGTYYNKAIPYINSDLSLPEITYLVNCCLTNNIGSSFQYLTINGTTQVVDKHVQFIPDSTSQYETILNSFYKIENN